MRSIQRLCFLSSPSLLSRFTFNSLPFTSSSSLHAQIEPTIAATSLTQEELAQINLLIPRLCSSNHLKEAANLITTAFLTNPSLESISVSIFIHRLSLEPDLTQPMYFLNRLKYTPKTQFFLLPICKMLASLYFRNREANKALKIFHWVSRPDFPCPVDYGFCALLVNGFCKNDMAVEGLKVLRMMVSGNLKVGSEVRMWVYRSLLREARIKEAQELNEALNCVENGDKGNEVCYSMLSDKSALSISRRDLHTVEQCLARLLTLSQTGRKQDLGLRTEVTGGPFQHASGGPFGEKEMLEALRIKIDPYK